MYALLPTYTCFTHCNFALCNGDDPADSQLDVQPAGVTPCHGPSASMLAACCLQAELVALQPQLVRTVAEVEKLMAVIAKEKAEVVEPKAAIVKEGE